VLVNNAGLGSPKPLHETDDAMFDHFVGVMLRAPFRLARDAIGHMLPGSVIINVTSTFAEIGGRRGGAYSAAKGGLKSLTEHMACEYGPRGIRSNCVAPGVTMTDMVRHRFDDEGFKRNNVETTPYPRLAEAEDIAATIAFLCSPGGEMINGQSIVVDGGWTKTKYLSPRALTTRWIAPQS
jgi:NAD(P)-dependent dehydrogenase (short-subunit alcohol dehydrogenase family)